MNPNIEFSIKTAQAYSAMCKPLCQELGLSQTALDILLFLANNPDYKTARDIVEVRHIKANLVSMNVDKLVQGGLSGTVRCGRRPPQNKLLCTGKADPIIRRGVWCRMPFSSACWTMWSRPIRRSFSGPWS